MNYSDGEDGKSEIVIVRRGGNGEDEGHHGGVWKIAFADFMTAMMCFFLVMWLINAANEQTKAAVASYFNPVKLVDRNSNRKGLDDVGEGPQSSSSTPDEAENTNDKPPGKRRSLSGPADEQSSFDLAEVKEHSDANLFADPYAVLAEIAAETGKLQNISSKGEGGAREAGPATGASGGESYRDPFAPDFWSKQVATPESDWPETSGASQEENLDEEKSVEQEIAEMLQRKPEKDMAEKDKQEQEMAAAEPQPAAEMPPAAEPRKGDRLEAAKKAAPDETATEKAAATAEEVKRQIQALFSEEGGLKDQISVVPVEGGVRIEITDAVSDGMFEIGSAVPRRDMVLAMEKIGAVLAKRGGAVTINGHTDGRPFRSRDYDNWRLSSARAQSAYYMLVRGGLDEKRVTHVSGFADRKLKDAEHPFADVNRRIEVLLEVAG